MIYAGIGSRRDFDDRQVRYSVLFGSPSSPLRLRVFNDPRTDSLETSLYGPGGPIQERAGKLVDTDWPVDSIEALEIAHANGGSEFAMNRPDSDLGLLKLGKDPERHGARTTWRVSYHDRTTSAVLRVWVDAATGEILEIEEYP